MEKEYVNALLSDINKSTSLEEKTHLITIFISELAKTDALNQKAIDKITETAALSEQAFGSIGTALDSTRIKIAEIDEWMVTLVNNDVRLSENQTKAYDHLVGIQESITKLNETFSSVYESIELIHKRIDMLEK